MPLTVRVATGDYPHTRGLGGRGGPGDDLDVVHEVLAPGDIFRRMVDEEAWDAAEMSLATIYMLADRGDRRFVPLPVFPLRVFRHSAVYVSSPEIAAPRDLAGRRAGVLRYGMTMAVWVRAFLAGDHGVPPHSLRWWTGEPEPILPAGLPIAGVLDGAEALERAALDGRLDCLLSTRAPRALGEGRLRRLFPDFEARERDYRARTGIVPIMHAVVVRRPVLERHPGLAARLVARCEATRAQAVEAGIETTTTTLRAFGRAMAAQGLTRRSLEPGDVFAAPS